MPYNYKTSKNLDRILEKLFKKDRALYEQLLKKMDEIMNDYDITHYKNLRYDMKDAKRAYVGHFVLVFQHDKKTNTILFEDFDHHDNIYKKR